MRPINSFSVLNHSQAANPEHVQNWLYLSTLGIMNHPGARDSKQWPPTGASASTGQGRNCGHRGRVASGKWVGRACVSTPLVFLLVAMPLSSVRSPGRPPIRGCNCDKRTDAVGRRPG